MATFVLIHGAGSTAWDWHLVAPELRKRGHETVAMDLPCEDESAGLEEYVTAVVDAIGDRRTELVVVAHSLGGFTAPLVCARVPAELLVLVAGMVPRPGETGIEWWASTGYEEADEYPGEDEVTTFFHDVPPDLAAEAQARGRKQTRTPMLTPWPLERWPDVPTRYLLFRDDRMFPAGWNRKVVRERLGIEPDEMDGGHCAYLSRPTELAERLDAYWPPERL